MGARRPPDRFRTAYERAPIIPKNRGRRPITIKNRGRRVGRSGFCRQEELGGVPRQMRQEPFGLRRVILGHRGSSDRIRGSEHNQWGTGARRRGTSSTSRGAAQGNLSP